MIERIAIASPSGDSRTTGRFTIASMFTIAIWGVLTIDWLATEPNQPVLLTVIVPSCRSFSCRRLLRALEDTSWTARFSPLIESWSASWMTGTIRPFSTAMAMPTLMRRLTTSPSSLQWALTEGCFRSASTTPFTMNGT